MHSVHPLDRRRLFFIVVFFSFLFCTLIARFYQIQILEGDKWKKEALAQHQCVVYEPFMRGSFYSNTSVKEGHPEEDQPFVIDVPKFHLFIDPDSIAPLVKQKMAEKLGDFLHFSKEQMSKLSKEFHRKSRSRKIASWLSREERNQLESWWFEFAKKEKIPKNALFFIREYKRSYPFGSMLGSLLHTVREDKDPITRQSIPTGGLEMLLNSYLQGKQGKKLVLRSSRHALDTGHVVQYPENGADIYLTINHYLQAIAESELRLGIEAAQAKGGWAIMMDPFNGEILALAQTPAFDPERYADYFNNSTLQDATKVRAVCDSFEPGSIFKPIMLALCLKANEELDRLGKPPLFYPEEKIATANGWFPGRTHPLKDGRTHRYLNMYMAVQKSSNVYMGQMTHRLIQTMGDHWCRKNLVDIFEFGLKTGVEVPAESPGVVPCPGKLHPNGKLEWSLPTPYSLAMGYNVLINSMQMVKAYAIFANGGKKVQPHLIRKIIKPLPDGTKKVLVDNTQYRASVEVLSPAVIKPLVKAMKFTTKEGGTAKRADIPGYTEAGKSGSSEKSMNGAYSKKHHMSSFIGFAPADRPRFVLMVVVDEPEPGFIPGVGRRQLGGICAGPIFREIAAKSLQYLGIAPDDPHSVQRGAKKDPHKIDWALEVKEMKQLYETWNAY